MDDRGPLLTMDDLTVSLQVGGAQHTVLEHVSFALRPGEARGLVGESGSGKSLTLRAILGLLPPNATVVSGRMEFDGQTFDLSQRSKSARQQLKRIRGAGISMIFQEPSVALNPVIPVGEQIIDAVMRRDRMRRAEARDYAIHLMKLVGIHDAEHTVDAYAFELSGGLKQRVMIAAAVAGKPKLILCDEPTTALDVTVQQQILSLFTHLRDELGAGVLYVTHDLAVVAQLCDSVTVLYSGNVMEASGDLRAVFERPAHPYTEALLRSTPDVDRIGRRLYSIPGTAPALGDRPSGCPFAPRCEYRGDDCERDRVPDTSEIDGRELHCLHPVGQDVSSVRLAKESR